MIRAFTSLFAALFLLAGCAALSSHQEARNAGNAGPYGVLIMAHGGTADWNGLWNDVKAQVKQYRRKYTYLMRRLIDRFEVASTISRTSCDLNFASRKLGLRRV